MSVATEDIRQLSKTDRCDAGSCNAQAVIICTLRDSELIFCGHHGRKFSSALIGQGFSIHDQSDVA